MNWRQVWREGLAPLLSGAELEDLRGALERDDQSLLQGLTRTPEGTCPLARGNRFSELLAVEDSSVFMAFWDDSPREVARLALLAEVQDTLAQRCCPLVAG